MLWMNKHTLGPWRVADGERGAISMIERRSFLIGGLSALAAPAIVRIENIMPVRKIIIEPEMLIWKLYDPVVEFQSWSVGEMMPPFGLYGMDLLSRAEKFCADNNIQIHIRTCGFRYDK